MSMPNQTNAELFARSLAVMPGGVSSPVRAFGSVGGVPRIVDHACGSRIVDVEGREYVDLVGSWGPMIAGHANPTVLRAVEAELAKSTSFGAPGVPELLLAEEIVGRIEPVEKVRFTSSGTEAVMTAVRLARAATSRDTIVKFAGCYHGHADAFLVAAGSGVASLGLPDSPGVPKSTSAETIVVPYGNLAAVEAVFAERGAKIAAIVTEAIPANMGVIVPPPGFNAALARIAHAHGALLVWDEVLTGFRVGPAGAWGREGALEGWSPDLFTFGKVVGGGLPLAAVGGSVKIMDLLAPAGPVYQAGTLSGNPIACTAGLATLRLLDAEIYASLDARANELITLATDALTRAKITHQVNQVGNLFSIFFAGEPVVDFASASVQSRDDYATFFHTMLDEGVWLPPSAFEAWFVSSALTKDDLVQVGAALVKAAQAVSAR